MRIATIAPLVGFSLLFLVGTETGAGTVASEVDDSSSASWYRVEQTRRIDNKRVECLETIDYDFEIYRDILELPADSDVRAAVPRGFAAAALGHFEAERALPVLERHVESHYSDSVRFSACAALILLGETDCFDFLIQSLTQGGIGPDEARGWFRVDPVTTSLDQLVRIAEHGKKLPPEVIDAIVDRLDDDRHDVRSRADHALSESTGVRLAVSHENCVIDRSKVDRCNLAQREIWSSWWQENRERYVDEEPYRIGSVGLEIEWAEDSRIEVTWINHGDQDILVPVVEGVAGGSLPPSSVGDLAVRPAAGRGGISWTPGRLYVAVGEEEARRRGFWKFVSLGARDRQSFPLEPGFLRLESFDNVDSIVVIIQTRRCPEGRWCGALFSNPIPIRRTDVSLSPPTYR